MAKLLWKQFGLCD